MMARRHMMQTWTSSFWLTMREFLRAFLLWAGVNLGGWGGGSKDQNPKPFLFPPPLRWLPAHPTKDRLKDGIPPQSLGLALGILGGF